MWGDMGRYGEMWGDVDPEDSVLRSGDMGRCGEMWGDMGRYGEMWGDVDQKDPVLQGAALADTPLR